LLTETQILNIIGRKKKLLDEDLHRLEDEINKIVESSRFLIIGAAGTIGSAVTYEIALRNPKALHLVDISENNLVEVVRQVRSTVGEKTRDFHTFAIDFGSQEFEALFQDQEGYDFVLNLAALKHVRSEKDNYTLSRMFKVNVLNSVKLQKLCEKVEGSKYFCVSTDKAANPANLMGASKLLMEHLLLSGHSSTKTSFARFANVAFSDGSLPAGFLKRIELNQPLSAPSDIERYFVTKSEAGQICLLSCLFGEDGQIFYPKLDLKVDKISFKNLACNLLEVKGFRPYLCDTPDGARSMSIDTKKSDNQWPCYFFESDTTGEKSLEEFYTSSETRLDDNFVDLGIVQKKRKQLPTTEILSRINLTFSSHRMKKTDYVALVKLIEPNFTHLERGKNLDQKM
jgi:FlaA1/EpsC-like NDP-sugar epimerase